MKRRIIFPIFLLVLLIFLPAMAGGQRPASGADPASESTSAPPAPAASSSLPEPVASDAMDSGVFLLLDDATGDLLTVSDRDFLYGAIVTEMPLLYEKEALKAQGIAAYTCYSKLRQEARQNPDASLHGADFSVNTKDWYIYTTKEQMQERWGENFDDYYARLTDVVDTIFGKTLKSDGELISAVYFAVSAGSTEASADIWGGERSYLQPVASPWDAYAAGYRTKVRLTESDFQKTFLSAYPDAVLGAESETWVQEIKRTDAGAVTEITIGGVTLTGGEVRTLFSLRSQNFTLAFDNGMAVFDVRGWGHGVGMSQNGANYLAFQGMACEEILAWYYPGTTLC